MYKGSLLLIHRRHGYLFDRASIAEVELTLRRETRGTQRTEYGKAALATNWEKLLAVTAMIEAERFGRKCTW